MADNVYTRPMPDYGDVFTVEEFKGCVRTGAFIDYDGSAHPAKLIDGKIMLSHEYIKPSRIHELSEDATHIAWFNR